jgi:hypothetical protein
MPRGGLVTTYSTLWGVKLTDDATETGSPVEFAIENVTVPREQGRTVRARDFSPHNRTFLTRPAFKVVITTPTSTLYWALRAAWADDSSRDTILYHRIATFDGEAKPDRSGGGFQAKWDDNFSGDQVTELVCPVAPTDGDWEAPE